MLEKLPPMVGQTFSGVRAGLAKTVFLSDALRQGRATLKVTSLAFAEHTPIPQRYTADGAGLSPPLAWGGVPPQTAAVVLIVEDADSPTPLPFVHAIAVDLPGEDGALAEGVMGGAAGAPSIVMGRNSLLQTAWLAPDPPPGHGVHRYAFQVFALAAGEPLGPGIGREALCLALARRALASGCLIGTCERGDGSISEPAALPATSVLLA